MDFFLGFLNPDNKTGIAIIISNDEWTDPLLKRSGNEKDIESLKFTFELYSIMSLHLHNKNVEDIKKVILEGKF